MSAMAETARQIGQALETRRWEGGVRVIVQGAMRALIENGQADLEASWRADVFYAPRQRKPSFTLVAETPGQLLHDLASIVGYASDDDGGDAGQNR